MAALLVQRGSLDLGEVLTCDVLGVPCFLGTLESAADAVIDRALSGRGGYGILCNVHVLMTARREQVVGTALENAWMIFPDGAPLAWLQRRAGFPKARRVGGPDLMWKLLQEGSTRGLRHAFVGSTPEVLEALTSRIARECVGARIVAAYAPPHGEESDESLLASLAAARPQVVWVALGAPNQEAWMATHAATLAPAVMLGVGAAFDFHAGTKKRAPAWMQRTGTEWLHRLVMEPRRLLRRYLATNGLFILSAAGVLLEKALPKRSR